ncbi:22689_t:CDS:1, partial [Dentiscutata erythropus]
TSEKRLQSIKRKKNLSEKRLQGISSTSERRLQEIMEQVKEEFKKFLAQAKKTL